MTTPGQRPGFTPGPGREPGPMHPQAPDFAPVHRQAQPQGSWQSQVQSPNQVQGRPHGGWQGQASGQPPVPGFGPVPNQRPVDVDPKRTLSTAVANECAVGGWRVQSQSDYNAILVKGKKVSHLLHLLLFLFTAGLWIFVWPILAIKNREKRLMISVDAYGNIIRNQA